MIDKIMKCYFREHSFNRIKPLKDNRGLYQCMSGCGMLAQFKAEEYLKIVDDYLVAKIQTKQN